MGLQTNINEKKLTIQPRGFEAGTSGLVSELGYHSATRDLLFDLPNKTIYIGF